MSNFNDMVYDPVYHCFINIRYSVTGSTKSMGDGIPASRGHSDSKRFSQRPTSSAIPVNYM
ncbi:MAG: hypothetical protein MR773_04595 [Eubacterium coprostanoligenes]|nr:hypothetical protein [Eubacterium coprostanoligenes]